MIKDLEQKNIDQATFLISDYINSHYRTVAEFCDNKEVDISSFKMAIKIVEYYFPNLYTEYQNKIRKKEEKNYSLNIKTCLENIIDSIKNGIQINDTECRSYEYLDFCLTTDLSINDFYGLCIDYAVINTSNLESIKQFITNNLKNQKITPEEIMTRKYTIKIDDEYKEFTELEKLQIISLMHDLELPMEEKIYRQVSKRYFTSDFNVEKIKIKSKLRKENI